MRVLQVLTYYRPHTSGLTIYVERLSRALAALGHDVTVLTSRFERSLPTPQLSEGVRIVRVPVAARVSKGVLMPSFGWVATREARRHDVIHLHLPQLDAAGVVLRGRVAGRPSVLTYHCDLTLPRGPFNRAVNAVVHVMNHAAATLADRIVAYTRDYAEHSPFLSRHRPKVETILPPVELPPPTAGAVSELARRHNPDGRRPIIGMAARLAAEKGVEVLLDALPAVLSRHPELVVWFAGQHRGVLGEQRYYERLEAAIGRHRAAGRWRFLGVLPPDEMAAFYRNLDAVVVPSLNATESFGLVQIEAMMCGVPVVASNLPGVRQPVRLTGMGRIAEVASASSLAAELFEVLGRPERYRGDPQQIAARFSPVACAAAYAGLYQELLIRRRR
jgi:glycosyltransferase involved in cell wall biosynthesis